MNSTKILLAAASLAMTMAAGAGAASAAPWDHRGDRTARHELDRREVRHDINRRIVAATASSRPCACITIAGWANPPLCMAIMS